jgi:hypothetical protein
MTKHIHIKSPFGKGGFRGISIAETIIRYNHLILFKIPPDPPLIKGGTAPLDPLDRGENRP